MRPLAYSREQSLVYICSIALTECPRLLYLGFIGLSKLKFRHCNWSVLAKSFRFTLRGEMPSEAVKCSANNDAMFVPELFAKGLCNSI